MRKIQMQFDAISIGDTTLDTFLKLNDNEAEVRCELDPNNCQICFNYASKIPVDALNFSLGGNASNNAVGLKRLGFSVSLYTIHGNDEIGRIVDEKLQVEELLGKYVVKQEGNTSYSTIINYKGERTILEKKYHRTYSIPADFPIAKYLYISSLGPDFEEFFVNVTKFAQKNKIRVGFNPAQPQLRADFKTYESIVRASYMVFMNKQEAEQMLGKKDLNIKEVLMDIKGFGPSYVAITDGVNGAYAYDGSKYYFCSIFPVVEEEATGAGDAFASGFMGALMYGKPTFDAIKWGMINSASVVTKVGATSGLLSNVEITEKIKQNPGFNPVEI